MFFVKNKMENNKDNNNHKIFQIHFTRILNIAVFEMAELL